MNTEQIQTLIESPKKFRDQVFLRLLWITGCRISELLGDKSWYPVNCKHRKEKGCLTKCAKDCEFRATQELRVFEPARVNDVDFEEGIIILKLLKRKKYPPGNHRVPLDSITLQKLQDYITEKNLPPNAPLFRFTRQRALQIIREAGASVGITKVGTKKLHNHHMRHSHCVAYVRQNNTLEGLRKLQKRIGHASFATTAEYLQFGEEAKKETEDTFGKF